MARPDISSQGDINPAAFARKRGLYIAATPDFCKANFLLCDKHLAADDANRNHSPYGPHPDSRRVKRAG